MSILDVVYASAPTDVVIISTVELDAPSFVQPIRNCTGFEDQTVTLETSEVVMFTAAGIDVALPARDESGKQDLVFAIENVTGEAQAAIDHALESGEVITMTYRKYLSVDLSAPAEAPARMTVINVNMNASTAQVRCSYNDIIGRAWPRRRYTPEFSPGLRYG